MKPLICIWKAFTEYPSHPSPVYMYPCSGVFSYEKHIDTIFSSRGERFINNISLLVKDAHHSHFKLPCTHFRKQRCENLKSDCLEYWNRLPHLSKGLDFNIIA